MRSCSGSSWDAAFSPRCTALLPAAWVVQAQRLMGGKRKIVSVSEITGMEGDQIQTHDLFLFEQTGVGTDGHATGPFIGTGIRPKCAERIEHRGIRLPADLFQRRVFE